MAIEIVDFPIKDGGSFHGKMLVHQRAHFFPQDFRESSSKTPEVLKFSAPVFMADSGVYTTTRVQGGARSARAVAPMQLRKKGPRIGLDFCENSNITIEHHHF